MADPTKVPGSAKDDDAASFKQACPEEVTLAEINEQNRKYWVQPASAGEKFDNEKK